MPKAFTQSERDRVRLTLLKKGREHFIRYGLRKTSIDDLVRATGIAKGTFYRFFESKEALFWAVHEASEEKLRASIMREVQETEKPADRLRVFLRSSFAILQEDPLMLAILGRGERESLAGFTSSREYEEHYRQDIAFMQELIGRWQEEGIVRQIDARVAANMVASAFFIFLQRETLGPEMHRKVADMLVECIVNYLSEQ